MSTKNFVIGGFVLITVIIVIILATTQKKSIREGSDFGIYNGGEGFMKLFKLPASGMNDSTNNGLEAVRWWFTFASKLDPDVADSIYAMCDIQTQESIDYYGLTQFNVNTLVQLKTALENVPPEAIKSLSDVNKLVSPTCANILNNKAGYVSKNGLYTDLGYAGQTPGVVDVF